jgi:hypothetical protein
MKKHIANNRIAPKKLNKIKNGSTIDLLIGGDLLFLYLCSQL